MEIINLASLWMHLKTQEREIAAKRIEVEEAMKQFLPLPVEGQKSLRAGDFKITATNKLYYKLDRELFETVKLMVPPEVRIFKETLDETAVKKAMKLPSFASDFQGVFEITPAKTSFEIVKVAV